MSLGVWLRWNESPEKYLFNGHQIFDNSTIFHEDKIEIWIKGKIEEFYGNSITNPITKNHPMISLPLQTSSNHYIFVRHCLHISRYFLIHIIWIHWNNDRNDESAVEIFKKFKNSISKGYGLNHRHLWFRDFVNDYLLWKCEPQMNVNHSGP